MSNDKSNLGLLQGNEKAKKLLDDDYKFVQDFNEDEEGWEDVS